MKVSSWLIIPLSAVGLFAVIKLYPQELQQVSIPAVEQVCDETNTSECPEGYACYVDEHCQAVPHHIPGINHNSILYKVEKAIECILLSDGYEVRFKPDNDGVCHAPILTVHQ